MKCGGGGLAWRAGPGYRKGMTSGIVRGWQVGVMVAVGLAVAGCGGGKRGDEAAGKPGRRAVLIGRVASVPAGRQFVLIQSYGQWTVPAGEPVFSVGPDERTANLLPTGERLGQFLAADLRSGEAGVGDAVYFRPKEDPKPGPAGQPGAPAAPAPPAGTGEMPSAAGAGTGPAKPAAPAAGTVQGAAGTAAEAGSQAPPAGERAAGGGGGR